MILSDKPDKKTRILFAVIGGITCLVGAGVAEALFHHFKSGAKVRDYHAPSIHFASKPDKVTKRIALPPPPPPFDPNAPENQQSPDIKQRLRRMNATSGEVQISLAWDNTNDLDLICKDPTGESTDGYNQASSTGGLLDVDMNPTNENDIHPINMLKLNLREGNTNPNRRTGTSNKPIENIYWPSGRAPFGIYKVYVHHFGNKEQVEKVPFRLEIKVRDRVLKFNSTLPKDDFARNGAEMKQVYTFEVRDPALDQPPPPPPQTTATTANTSGNTANPSQNNPPVPQFRTETTEDYKLEIFPTTLKIASLWGLIIGLLPFALYIGQQIYMGEKLFRENKGFLCLFAAPVCGIVASCAGQSVHAFCTTVLPPYVYPVSHFFSWLLVGGAFSAAIAFMIPRLTLLPTAIVGVSSFAFTSLFLQGMNAVNAGSVGRIVSSLVIGSAIGALILLPKRLPSPAPEKPADPPPPKPKREYPPPAMVGSSTLQAVGRLRSSKAPTDDSN